MWKEEAQQMRDDPGEWKLLTFYLIDQDDYKDNKPRHLANRINQGLLFYFCPKGAFQAVSRKLSEEGVVKVYARYVGENKEYA